MYVELDNGAEAVTTLDSTRRGQVEIVASVLQDVLRHETRRVGLGHAGGGGSRRRRWTKRWEAEPGTNRDRDELGKQSVPGTGQLGAPLNEQRTAWKASSRTQTSAPPAPTYCSARGSAIRVDSAGPQSETIR